jgi:hypothetical protein
MEKVFGVAELAQNLRNSVASAELESDDDAVSLENNGIKMSWLL